MTRAEIGTMCPFFIVSDVGRIIGFYRDRFGFEVRYKEPDQNPFFGIVGRDGAMLFVKVGEAAPLPNPHRDPAMKWDAYVYTTEPAALAAEFTERGVSFKARLSDTSEGLRGFELCDPDGYVLFFGCPKPDAVG